ncbi:hypothetical protein CL617_04630 [archaeon]|nr:hypothetical protein [archaeon]|tara:strand:- start:419 stop:2551 length:2133 start_codon:yes stop_codon:yes gene_type:complete
MKRILFLTLILAIFLISSVNAANIDIITPKDDYLAKETFQAEIILNIDSLSKISTNNLKLINETNSIIPVQYFLEQLTNKHYFIYFNLPNIDQGIYKFQLDNIQYKLDNSLKIESPFKEFNIKKLNPGFDYLLENQNSDGSFNSISETALASLALKNIYPSQAKKSLNYLENNQDPLGCYPKGNCNIKDTSFALLSLHNFNKDTTKITNWLLGAQNNFDIGSWTLTLNSGSSCLVNNQNYQTSQSIDINVNTENLIISCDAETEITLKHSFLGNVKTIQQLQATEANITIDNSQCFGKNYKSECDYESTSLALYSLKQTGNTITTNYLQENPSDTKTLDQAFLNLLNNNQYSKDWLENNLITNQNAWSLSSVSISQTPDVYSTIFATLSLKDTEQYEKSIKYLEKQTTNNILNSALILHLFLADQQKEPIISIFPAFINKKGSFDLIIKNENNIPTLVKVNSPNFTNIPASFTLENTKVFSVNVPKTSKDFNIEIDYGNNSYSISVITGNLTQGSNGIKPLIQPPENSILILTKDLSEKTSLIATLLKEDEITDDLRIKNNWDFILNNIKIELTGNLAEIIELEKYNYNTIQPNEILKQKIIINKNKNSLGLFEGELIITTDELTLTSLPISLTFTEDESKVDTLEDNDKDEINETEEDNGPTEDDDKISPWIWLIPFFILVTIGIIIFIYSRGPKNNTFNKYIEGIKKK